MSDNREFNELNDYILNDKYNEDFDRMLNEFRFETEFPTTKIDLNVEKFNDLPF